MLEAAEVQEISNVSVQAEADSDIATVSAVKLREGHRLILRQDMNNDPTQCPQRSRCYACDEYPPGKMRYFNSLLMFRS